MNEYSQATAFDAEGARVGIVTCKRCGVAVLIDPRDERSATEIHDRWHDNQPADERVSVGELRRLRALKDELRDVLDENVALHRKTTILATQIPKFRVAEIAMLELWQALGGDPVVFLDWFTEPGRTPADAWSQLLGAVAGGLMAGDTNPEPGAILALVWNRTVEG